MMNMKLQYFGGRGSGGGKGGGSKISEGKTFSIQGEDAKITKEMTENGSIINYTGNNLGDAVQNVANRLSVGDEFVVSNSQLGYLTPNPTAADRKGVHRETRFVVTDSYRYGNGFAPVYGNNTPELNKGNSKSWRKITDGALYLDSGTAYQIRIKRNK